MKEIPRKVLIVEDDALFASLVQKTLVDVGFQVETAHDAQRARRKINSFDPDLVLLDLGLGDGPSGVHLAHAISETRPDIAVLVLSKYSSATAVSSQSKDLPDSVGYIRKHQIEDPLQLIEAIDKVLSDRSQEVRHDRQDEKPLAALPAKGQEVLRLLADGFSNQEIAKRSNLSVKSVERWIDRAYKVLGIQTTEVVNARVVAATTYLRQTGAADKI